VLKASLFILAIAAILLLPRYVYAKDDGTVTVSTVVFADQNGDGVPNNGEPGLPSIRVCFVPDGQVATCVLTDADGRATARIPAGRVRFQIEPRPQDKEFVCTNVDSGQYGDSDPCGFTSVLSTQNLIVVNWIGLKRIGWRLFLPAVSR
jgi:hypothetical protein